MTTFKIIRFRQNRPSKIVARGLTLEEAQKHTSSPKTRGKNWFDGYTKEE
jgi:hypothetical protein